MSQHGVTLWYTAELLLPACVMALEHTTVKLTSVTVMFQPYWNCWFHAGAMLYFDFHFVC